MQSVIESFMATHQLPDVTIVADLGMVSEANQKQVEASGLPVHPLVQAAPVPLTARRRLLFEGMRGFVAGWIARVTRRLEHVPRVAEVALGEREDLCRSHREHQDALALITLEAVVARLVLPAAVPLTRPDFC